ncbi:hypothetical protein M8J77_010166 [Diaphorina citri]|nr:hypothetical protein M8J77_010166 [Diaphorina citri]
MFFQAKHPAVSADKLDTQLSTVTCSELRPLLQVCQPFGLVPFSLQTYQSSSRHHLVMGIKAECTPNSKHRSEPKKIRPRWESNPRPPECKSNVIPTPSLKCKPNVIPTPCLECKPNVIPTPSLECKPNVIPTPCLECKPNVMLTPCLECKPNVIPTSCLECKPNVIPTPCLECKPNVIPTPCLECKPNVIPTPCLECKPNVIPTPCLECKPNVIPTPCLECKPNVIPTPCLECKPNVIPTPCLECKPNVIPTPCLECKPNVIPTPCLECKPNVIPTPCLECKPNVIPTPCLECKHNVMLTPCLECITQKEKTISILRRLETAIFHLKTLGILRKRETHHVRLRVLTYTFLFYVNVVITHVNYPRLFRGYYFEGFLFTTASALSNSIVFLIELQYIIFFYVIYRKFLLINDTFSQAKSFAHYKQLVIIHNKLCDLCYDVNEVFDQQILILITYIICNIYGVVVIFIEAMNGHVAITKQLNQHTFVLFQSADPDSHHVSFHVNHL